MTVNGTGRRGQLTEVIFSTDKEFGTEKKWLTYEFILYSPLL